jgi:hypothetical protein
VKKSTLCGNGTRNRNTKCVLSYIRRRWATRRENDSDDTSTSTNMEYAVQQYDKRRHKRTQEDTRRGDRTRLVPASRPRPPLDAVFLYTSCMRGGHQALRIRNERRMREHRAWDDQLSPPDELWYKCTLQGGSLDLNKQARQTRHICCSSSCATVFYAVDFWTTLASKLKKGPSALHQPYFLISLGFRIE